MEQRENHASASSRIIASAILALLALAIVAWQAAESTVSAEPLPTQLAIRNGTHAWMVKGAASWGARWHLAEPIRGLVVQTEDLGRVPQQYDDQREGGWRLLGQDVLRTGLLEVGWPRPWIGWRFAVTDPLVSFPPPVEASDETTTIVEALRRVGMGEGRLVVTTTSIGWALTAYLFCFCACYGLIEGVSRQGAAEARGRRTGTSLPPRSP